MSAIVSAAVDIPLSLSSEKNYIVEVVLPGGSTSANIEDGRITAEGASQALATVVYYDGLGRPEQTARVGFTATGADLLSTVSYDEAGREYRQGLPTPVSGNNGCYVNPSTYGQTAQSYYGDTYLYRETLYENSPLSRTVGVKIPELFGTLTRRLLHIGAIRQERSFFSAFRPMGYNEWGGIPRVLFMLLAKPTRTEFGKRVSPINRVEWL